MMKWIGEINGIKREEEKQNAKKSKSERKKDEEIFIFSKFLFCELWKIEKKMNEFLYQGKR